MEYWTLWIVAYNCFDELFVCEWAFSGKDNDNGNFRYNLTDANYTEEKH